MLQFNKNLNKGKTQLIGRFKLPFSLNGALENNPKWVDEKETEKVENLIGHLFTNYLRGLIKQNEFVKNYQDLSAIYTNRQLKLTFKSVHLGIVTKSQKHQ